MGGTLGTIFARAGHEVVFSYARSEQKLKTLARNAKGDAKHGTPREAAQEADAVLLAVHWSRVDDVLKKSGDLSGKPGITCSLPMNDDDTGLVIGHTSSGAEELKKRLPKARVVAAFDTVPSGVLFGVYEAKRKARRLSLVYCGDDPTAKEVPSSSYATPDSSPWMQARCASPDTPSRSRCSSVSWRTEVPADRNWHTGSNG
jgi:predicted dinucleotide-binding enzyme